MFLASTRDSVREHDMMMQCYACTNVLCKECWWMGLPPMQQLSHLL